MDLEAFLKDVLTPLLDHPEQLRVEVSGEGRKREALIFAAQLDRGRIIAEGSAWRFNRYADRAPERRRPASDSAA